MYEKGSLMLRVLLNRFPGSNKESLLQALPENDVQRILSIPVDSPEIEPLLRSPFESVRRVHYSWLISQLQSMDKEKLPLILALFPDSYASKLRQRLNLTSKSIHLSSSAKRFLTKQLYNAITFESVLPLEYLPPSEMTQLAQMENKDLLDLIDYLGLYDLAEEIQLIVDKYLLEQIYTCLSFKKRKFLRMCLHQKEKLITQRLQLEYWDGDCNRLHKLLHHKGIVRLGYALSGQHKDLFWHITHLLDTGRGKKLLRYYTPDPLAGITNPLIKQVKRVITFFKKEKNT